MKKLNKIIYLVFFILLLHSCSNNNPLEIKEPESNIEQGIKVSFIVNKISTRGGSNSEVQEKIGSLRIIMISDGFLEYNTKIDLTSGTVSDNEETPSFPYLFNRSTVPGNKKFYIIANEESVGQITFETEETLPDGITNGMSLSSFLNFFTRDKLPAEGTLGYSSSGKGSELETLLNSAYFNVDYNVNDGIIYLPYTAYYDGIVSDDDPEKIITETMYLVPVSTKFTVRLYNYRKEKVIIEKLNLESFNENNFLMAKLDETEKTKTFAGKSYPWIEWLKLVAEGSKVAQDLDSYNRSVGWIEKYFIPEDAELKLRELMPSTGEDWSIEKLVNLEQPSMLTVTAYLAESKNYITKQVYNNDTKEYDDVTYQAYYLQLFARDYNKSEVTASEKLEIDAAKALFRNTHVIVDVDMYDSMVDIYCQIQPWDYSSYKGYLQEVDDD